MAGKKRAGEAPARSILQGVGPLENREPPRTGVPFFADLLLDRKARWRNRRMHDALFFGFWAHDANEVINDRLFPYVPLPCATPGQARFGHR
jgi:hypothetical protein